MDERTLLNGLIGYACLIPAIALHEFAHAWMADRCGDDTPRLQGRVTLNPLAHMELMGTVILPLACIFLANGFMFGWGRPVQVNPSLFGNRRRDDTLVSLAGPGMNLLLALLAMMLAKVGTLVNATPVIAACIMVASTSLVLGFFNLLPIPPLDGSHVAKNLILMREETYLNLCQYGFVLIFIAIQIPFITHLVLTLSSRTLALMAAAVGL